MKWLKKQYNVIYDMLQKSGFGLNNIKKCVEVNSDEVWQAYVQVRPNITFYCKLVSHF